MNYIKQLEAENLLLKEQLAKAAKQATDFMVYLRSDKFTGTDNGERKDWISTSDLNGWLMQHRSELTL